jgi:LysR family glycine cleavage system transcriptional activator
MPSVNKLPLNALPTFVLVARLENLRTAAEQMHLTHGAVSQQIATLEARLGFALFERRGRRVILNDAGRALLAGVEPALQVIHDSAGRAAMIAGSSDRNLRLNVVSSLAQRWLMPRMKHWRALHPGITLEIEVSPQLIDLDRNGCHVALRGGDGPWPGLITERLYDTPARFVVVGSPEAHRRLSSQSPAALTAEPMLDSGGMWEHWFEAAGVSHRPSPVATFNDQALMLQAAEQGMGVAVAREILVADAIRAGSLAQLSRITFVYEGASGHSLVYPEGLRVWAPLSALRTWLRKEFNASFEAIERYHASGVAFDA